VVTKTGPRAAALVLDMRADVVVVLNHTSSITFGDARRFEKGNSNDVGRIWMGHASICWLFSSNHLQKLKRPPFLILANVCSFAGFTVGWPGYRMLVDLTH
jgi:hypothetical protein